MIIMNLELENIYGFCDFKINFSYPKKIVGTTIECEYLRSKENFRYKKVNIIMGGNASGKTTLGKAMRDILNFINRGHIGHLSDSINNIDQDAYFSIDFLLDEESLYRINCKFREDEILHFCILKANIDNRDSYEKACKNLETLVESEKDFSMDMLRVIEGDMGWNFAITDGEEKIQFTVDDGKLGLKVLENVLMALDTDIKSVDKIDDVYDSYVIRKEKQSFIVQEGEVVQHHKLSSGTKAGISIANIISAVITNRNGFYYCDEKFAYVHSDLEKVMLSVMIEKLHDGAQLFFTSHNMDLLDMNLPMHSYTFLKKQECINAVYPKDFLKKNNASLKNAIENDIFNISPDLSKLYEIEEVEYGK